MENEKNLRVTDATISRVVGHHTDPIAALRDLQNLRLQIDEVAHAYARRARNSGESWTNIGRALGVSKQAAQQRYGD